MKEIRGLEQVSTYLSLLALLSSRPDEKGSREEEWIRGSEEKRRADWHIRRKEGGGQKRKKQLRRDKTIHNGFCRPLVFPRLELLLE